MGEARALRVGITGASSDLGRCLLPRLHDDPAVEQMIAFDVAKPTESVARLEYVRVDLTRPGMEEELTARMREARLDALYHLAFVNSRVHGARFAHELEVIGSMHVLAAAGAVKLPRLIVPSLTALYGARPNAPAFLREGDPLMGCEGSRFITDRVEVEHQVEAFAAANPDTHVVVLRFAPLMGARANNPLTRLLRTRLIPSVLGFDPLWQVVHEDDAADALHRALHCADRGAFNIACKEVLPFSTLVRLSGGFSVPLPGPILRATIHTLESMGVPSVPVPLLDFLTYNWVADVKRATELLGFEPRRSALRAAMSLAGGTT